MLSSIRMNAAWMRPALLCLVAVATAACASTPPAPPVEQQPGQSKLTKLWVKHHLVPCGGWQGQDYCFAVAEDPQGPWSLAKGGLQNFYYQWGYSYQLLVAPSPGGGADANEARRVIAITKKRPAQVGTEFTFAVKPERNAFGSRAHLSVEGGVGRILMGPTFTCATRELCSEIKDRLSLSKRFVVKFAYDLGRQVRAVGVGDTIAAATAKPTLASVTRFDSSPAAEPVPATAILPLIDTATAGVGPVTTVEQITEGAAMPPGPQASGAPLPVARPEAIEASAAVAKTLTATSAAPVAAPIQTMTSTLGEAFRPDPIIDGK